MLIVTDYVYIAPPDVSAFIEEMAAFAAKARSRDGCLFFAAAPEDAATGRMLVSERWRDQAALDAHFAAEDTVALIVRWGGRMENELAAFDASDQRSLMASDQLSEGRLGSGASG